MNSTSVSSNRPNLLRRRPDENGWAGRAVGSGSESGMLIADVQKAPTRLGIFVNATPSGRARRSEVFVFDQSIVCSRSCLENEEVIGLAKVMVLTRLSFQTT